MKVSLSRQVKDRIRRALRKSGSREIGGMLFAEQLSPGDFCIVDFSTDAHSGSFESFRRDPRDHARALDEFFQRTHKDYSRFNYLGEWHSHPSFSVSPSSADMRTMSDIVNDARLNITFAALLIVRLRFHLWLDHSVSVFARGHLPFQTKLSSVVEMDD